MPASLTITQTPPKFQSAYKPLLVKVTSSRFPVNNGPGESNLSVDQVKVADATDVTTWGAPLTVGDVFIRHAPVFPGVINVGDSIKLFNMDSQLYNGIHKVTGRISSVATIIDAENEGTANSGRMSKHYAAYNVIAEMTTENGATAKYRLTADPDGVFVLDCGPLCRRSFKDIFEVLPSDSPVTTVVSGNGYITQRYSVNFSEAFIVVDEDTGVGTYTELGKSGARINYSGGIAVNSVQPYHHINERTGQPDHEWMDDLDDYIIENDVSDRIRFLTYGLRGQTGSNDPARLQRVAEGEDFFLSGLWDAGVSDNVQLRFTAYGADNLQDETDTINITIPDCDSFILNVSPDALGVLPATTSTYYVAIENGLFGGITERFFLSIHEPCATAARFYALNSFGAVDQYTVEGRDTVGIDIDRRTVEKPHMALDLTTTQGDWNRRTYAVDYLRTSGGITRNESRANLRWIMDEIVASVDTRARIYSGDIVYTPVIFESDRLALPTRAGRIDLTWSYGVGGRKQRR